MVKYGLSLPNGGPNPRDIIQFASLAEDSGWDGIFLEDYLIWQGHQEVPTYDPWILLTGMAMVTKRIRLGTMVTPLTRRRPWKVASECTTLDLISNGRMILGVGLGDTESGEDSFSLFGEITDSQQRAKMLDECLAIIHGIWQPGSFHFDGKYYHVKEINLQPKPVQKPGIPIWVGGAYPFEGPLRRAAQWNGSCLYKHKVHFLLPEDLRDIKAFIESNRSSDEPYDYALGGCKRWDDEEKQVQYMRSLIEEGMTWWLEYVPPNKTSIMKADIARGPLRI
jgi:alkanesulfonate monooxygenase SsuD/methylene tetrahydromethanopterin reductase-like flavin-dependent oxidoreductase (luciferase family)